MTHDCATRSPGNYCPSCHPSFCDTNVAPPPAPPEPAHVILTKGGITRRILKAEATREVMAAIAWEPHHPLDYSLTPTPKENQ
jgi:hypothetical protein